MLHVESFDLSVAMHAIELMDPKVDPGAMKTTIPSVGSRILDGSLPIHTLTHTQTAMIMDALMELESSWRNGNSLPQTILTCLYTHTHTLAAMRAAVGETAHPKLYPDLEVRHMTSLADTGVEARGIAGVSVDAAEIPAVPRLDSRTPAHTCVSALLAYCTAVLKSAEFSYAAVMRANMYEDEDFWPQLYGTDLAYGVSLRDTFRSLLASEAALLQSIGVTVSDGAVDTLFAARADTPAHQRPWMSADHALLTDAVLPPGDVAALVHRLRFRRAYLTVQVLLSKEAAAPAPAPFTCGAVFPLESCAAAVATAVRALEAVRSSSAFTAAGVDAAAVKQQTPGLSSDFARGILASQTPRFVPLPGVPATFSEFAQHLANLQYVCLLPTLASYSPARKYAPIDESKAATGEPRGPAASCEYATLALARLARASAAWQHDGIAGRLVPTDLAPSGIVDGPLDWPSSSALAGCTTTSAVRQHISLLALLDALFDFSLRNADIVVRSTMVATLGETPRLPPKRSHEGTSTSEETAKDELADYATSHERSSVIFGTHTLQELIRTSISDCGVHEELLHSIEGKRLVYLLDKPMMALLRSLCATRMRMRRRMDTHLRDWAFIVRECETLDQLYASGLEHRLNKADDAFVECNAQRSLVGAKAAAAVPRPDGLTDEYHKHLLILQVTSPMCRLQSWAVLIATRLISTHLEIGFESQLYHPDELTSVYWHLDFMLSHIIRHIRSVDSARQLRHNLPAIAHLTAASERALAGGKGYFLLDMEPSTEAASSPSGPDAECAAAGATAGAKKKKGKSAGAVERRKEDAHKHARTVMLPEAHESWLEETTAVVKAVREAPTPYSREQDLALSAQCVCRGLFRLLTALRMSGVMGSAKGLESALRRPELVYHNRFKDYAVFTTPKPLPYEEYTESFATGAADQPSVRALLEEAHSQFQTAKAYAARVASHCKACLVGTTDVLKLGARKLDLETATAIFKARQVKRQLLDRANPGITEFMNAQDPTPATAAGVLYASRDLASGMRLARVGVASAAFVTRLLQSGALWAHLPMRATGKEEPASSLPHPKSHAVSIELDMHPHFASVKIPGLA